ncbi:hypothetical protein TcWFU_007041 [Taenia crassiceps]|uniref:Uncharacterized protein n=1 Tax=Taenia crassiceps TaxID=6207 RepID=A0ABR4Q1H8_9CEST
MRWWDPGRRRSMKAIASRPTVVALVRLEGPKPGRHEGIRRFFKPVWTDRSYVKCVGKLTESKQESEWIESRTPGMTASCCSPLDKGGNPTSHADVRYLPTSTRSLTNLGCPRHGFVVFPPTGTYPVNIVEYFEEDDASSVESHLDVEGDMRVWEHTGDATTWSVWLVESCSGEDDSTSSRRTAEVPKCMHLIPACVVVAVTAAATTDDDGGNVDGDGDGDVGGSDDGGSGGDGDCRPNSCRQKQLNKGEEVGVSIIENDSMTGNKNESSKEKKEEEEEKVVVVEEEEEEEEGEKEEGEGEGEGESERKDEWRMLKMEEKVEMEMEMEMGMEVETVDLAKTEDEVEVEVEVEVGADAEETRIKAEGKRRSVGWLKRFRARVKNRFRLSRLRACGWRRKGMLQ